MTNNDSLAIGLDLGTSGIKALAIDSVGNVVGRASATYPTHRPEHGAAEQDPNDWIRARDMALLDLSSQTDATRWGVIALSAMLPTLVEIHPDGHALSPAITWEDGRAESDAQRIIDDAGEAFIYRTTGQRLDGRYLLPMHNRLARSGAHDDTIVSGAKDFLFASLTGILQTDPSTATGYGAYSLAADSWNESILTAASMTVSRLPTIAAATSSAPLLDAAAKLWGCPSGIPVLLGAADSVLGAYGLGVNSPETVAYIAGTSTVILGWSAAAEPDPQGRYLVTPMAENGYGLEMDLLATGSALAWLAGLFGMNDTAALVALAGDGSIPDSPLVLPYLTPGEQGALWDSTLQGAIHGVTLRTTRSDLARGLLAGIVMESCRCLSALSERDITGRGSIVISGRGGTSAAFRQALADASGRVVLHDPSEHDHSALGAALLGGRSVLGWTDSQEVRGRFVAAHPDHAATNAWSRRLERYERARTTQSAWLSQPDSTETRK